MPKYFSRIVLISAFLTLGEAGINNAYAANTAPVITTQPANASVTAPATATFSVVATGTPAPTYQWQSEAPGAASYTSISGATSTSYTTPATTTANSGTKYECVVTNSAGTVTSNAATLTVNSAGVPGLVGWWKLTDGSGTTTVDSSGNGDTGTLENGPSWVAGNVWPYALTFNGTNNGVLVNNSASLNLSGSSISIAAWIKVSSNNSTYREIVRKGTTASPSWFLLLNTANEISLSTTGNGNEYGNGYAYPADGNWHHVAGVYNGSTCTIYLDGVEKTSYTCGVPGNDTSPLTMGYLASGSQYFAGSMDDVRVYNIALSSTQVAQLYATPSSPQILTQPMNETVTAPATGTFAVTAYGTPAPTYQWKSEASGATTYTAISGATSASYTTPATTTANSGTKYECVLTNSVGSLTSNAAVLTVNPTGTTNLAGWWKFTDGSGTTAADSSGNNNTGTLENSPSWVTGNVWPYALSFNGTNNGVLVNNSASLNLSGSNLSIAAWIKVSSNNSTYRQIVRKGSTSLPAWFLSLNSSNEISLSSSANSSEYNNGYAYPADGQWHHVAGVYNGSTCTIYLDGVAKTSYTCGVPGNDTSPLVIGYVTGSSQYFAGSMDDVRVYNIALSATQVAQLYSAASGSQAPVITTQPVNATVTAPATATFSVVATGTPAPTYQWQSEASGATTYTAISGATSASYTTPATTTANSGTKYECVVTNSAGNATSTAATLTVNPASSIPVITTQPLNATVTAPATATFSVVATGTPTPTYQWQSEASGATTYTAISGATSASYTTPATTTANSGTKYECVVTNSAGNVTSTAATLTVNPASSAPVITTQPSNATVTVPSTATFTVTATGTPSPTYQWESLLYGGSSYTVISGATSASYTTTATTIASNGTTYKCVITNSFGSVTTTPVVLTVLPYSPPIVTITGPADNSVLAAYSNFTVTANASEPFGTIASVTFDNGAALIGTSFSPPYSYTVTGFPPGTYSVTATAMDTGGYSTTSSPVTFTVVNTKTQAAAFGIVSPANNSTLTTGSINLTAIVPQNGGTISNVAFYNGATLLGKVVSNSQAFTYTWANVPAGTYNLTAVSTNSAGTTVTSSPVKVTVNSSPYTVGIDNNIATATDALGHTTNYQYDKLNRLLKTSFADASTVSEAYDLFGNQISVTDQRGNILTKTYDAYDRLSQTKDPLGAITQFAYNTNGDLLSLTDANGHATSYTYDADDRVLTQTNALNLATAYAYDPVGNVTTRTDANGKATKYTYDALNHLTNTTYPDATSVANVYDALGRRISMLDSTGQTTYTYDALNRLLSKTSNGTAVSYTYDGEGNELTLTDQNDRTITNTYDALNRVVSVNYSNGITTYGYDADSNNNLVSNPGLTQSYTFDVLNRVIFTVNSTASGVISSYSNVYDVAGMIIKKSFADGSWTTYTYDALNQLLSEEKQTSTAIVYDYVYTYDLVGNRLTWMKETTLGGFWSVDSLNMPPQVLTNMTSAGYGSTTSPTQALTLARNYSYDAGNRLTGWTYAANIYSSIFPVQTDSYTYDNNGNRLSKQAVLTGETSTPQQTGYAYDFENRLNKLTYTNVPGITGADSFSYSAEGLRVEAVLNGVATSYLYDGANVLNERNGSGTTTKTYARGLDLGGGIRSLINQNTPGASPPLEYYDYNDLGSTADLVTLASGTAVQSYSYDAYGNLLAPQASGDNNRYLFSTKEFDARSGLSYFGRRYYDPEIGRWLTADPLGFVGGDINLYAYVGNSPLDFVDPDGLLKVVVSGGGHLYYFPGGFAVGGSFGSEVSNKGPFGIPLLGTGFNPEAVIGELGDIGLSAGISDISNSCGERAGNPISFGPFLGKYLGVQITPRNDAVWYNPSTWIDGIQVGLGVGVSLPVTYTINLPKDKE